MPQLTEDGRFRDFIVSLSFDTEEFDAEKLTKEYVERILCDKLASRGGVYIHVNDVAQTGAELPPVGRPEGT